MRVLSTPLRGLVLAGALTLVISSGAYADGHDKESAAAIQIKLVQARQHINDLYGQAAVASERLNGAIYHAQLAKADVARNKAAVAVAEKSLKAEKESVAELTVQDIQSGSGMARLATLFSSAGPGQLLDRSTAYSSTQEAMNAHIDSLTASTVVYDAAIRRASKAEAEQRKALSDQASAKAEIEKDISTANASLKKLTTERAGLLKKLAAAQKLSVAKVTKRQDQIDKAIDAEPATPTQASSPAASNDSQPSRPAPPKPSAPPARPPVVSAPPASGSVVDRAIAFAKAQLGEPYQWGGAGPNSWDCSGLTMMAYAAAGINIPHYGVAQYEAIKHVSMSNIQRGDLLFWSNGSVGSIYHVAMYLGGGQIIQAPRTGRNVEIVPLSYWIQPDLAGRPG